MYDNTGFRIRGHQFTNAQGAFSLTTIVPGLYPGRTRHIHVKVQHPTAYAIGASVTHAGLSYRCRIAHTSLPGWEPPNAPALWQRV